MATYLPNTIFQHRIYCLHGVTGQITSDVAAVDTSFVADASVLADVTIAVGSIIQLDDGVTTSPELTIISIDSGTNTITVDQAIGSIFLAATPANVVRIPHWAYEWTYTSDELTACPEDPSHPFQPGSASIANVTEPTIATITQSESGFTHPEVLGQRLDVTASLTGFIDFERPYLITAKGFAGYTEAANEGDRFDILAGPDTFIGVLTGSALVGATTIAVSPSVIANIRPSLLVKLEEGATTNDLGRVISVDAGGGTITVETATTDAFSPGANVLITIMLATDLPVPTFPSRIDTGVGPISGADIPAGTKIRVVYRNAGPSNSKAIIYFNYLT